MVRRLRRSRLVTWTPEQWLLAAVLLQAHAEAHSRDPFRRAAAQEFLAATEHLWGLLNVEPPQVYVKHGFRNLSVKLGKGETP